MDFANQIIFFGALIFFISILASLVSARFGVPLLLVFLALGMLVGEDGPGGVVFNNVAIAHTMSMLALAVILFDGGLRTDTKILKTGLLPAISLATIGVLLTALLVGWVASKILHISLLQGLLIGAIIAPTDVAAVFASLQLSKISLTHRIAATLEIESGSNDPMAIFLTLTLIGILTHGGSLWQWSTLFELISEMVLGAGIGFVGGYLLIKLINRIKLNLSFYPLLVMAGSLMIFGIAPYLGGNAFLAIYLAGLTISHYRLKNLQHVLSVHNGLAWLGQIGLFLMLGLLVTPSELIPHLGAALLIGLMLIFVARPLGVLVSLLPFRFEWREKLFISWVGLRGAVPIILALFPYLAKLPHADIYFNVAFFVVLMSLLIQAWTIVPIAKWLNIARQPNTATEHISLSKIQPEYEMVVHQIPAANDHVPKTCNELVLPDNATLVLVMRQDQAMQPGQVDELKEGDLIYILTPERHRAYFKELFSD